MNTKFKISTCLLLTVFSSQAWAQEVTPATSNDLQRFERAIIEHSAISKPERIENDKAAIRQDARETAKRAHEDRQVRQDAGKLIREERKRMDRAEVKEAKRAEKDARRREKEKLKAGKKQDAASGRGPTDPRNVRESVKGSKKSKNK